MTMQPPDTLEQNECYVCKEGNYKPWGIGRNLCEVHDVCVDCGIKRKDLGHSPWGVKIGAFQCKPCEEKERKVRIAKRIESGFEHEYTDKVTCPHCGRQYCDSWEMSEGKTECDDCGKHFEIQRHVYTEYSTEKVKP